ncbi:MAG TPA: hypothetical protein VNW90_22690 [Acetobacteraceae bacterium]|nr:hypothetical protein [Acetobacteraceae bacterium]
MVVEMSECPTTRMRVVARSGVRLGRKPERFTLPSSKCATAVLRDVPGHHCNGFAKDGHLILQADHLITRAKPATYADARLLVCVCKGAHAWKSLRGNRNKAQYDALVKTNLSPERVILWEA